MRDIGLLTVKVFRAQGLTAADYGGTSDPFCVLELVNARLQTQTQYKTLNPEWNKVFTFRIKDIHNVLEVTVYDEDPNKKIEFLGKVAIPLLKIGSGERKWYALKNRRLQRRAKGQIQLECDLIWNPIKAGIRTFNPLEEKYLPEELKFKRQVFMRHVTRVKKSIMSAVEIADFLQSCFLWESKVRSLMAFAVFLISVYFFELYMAPLALLIVFAKSYIYDQVAVRWGLKCRESNDYFDSEEEDDGPDDKENGGSKEERKSIRAKVQAINDALNYVQSVLDYSASLMERVKNTFNFTQPFLSFLAIFVLSVATIVIYLVPLRFLIMVWGINKFTKRLRNPHAIPNNELLDFLSRIPSDTEVKAYGEFRPEALEPAPRRQDSKLSRKGTT
jgi:hypothetical protein